MRRDVGEIRNQVSGIAANTNVAKITVRGVIDRPGNAARLFESLTAANISVDVIVQNTSLRNETDMTFTVKTADLEYALRVVKSIIAELGGGEVISAQNLAKISIVGTGMLDAPGYAARMFRILADNDVNIDIITTSEIRITCIIPENRLLESARALHAAFELDKPQE